MVSYDLAIISDEGSLKIGPFSADVWPNPGDILKMDLTFERNGTQHLDGPKFDVIECNRDDREVVVKRHVGQ